MDFSSELAELVDGEIPSAMKQFGSVLDAEWVADAVEESGTATVRRRKMPVETVVWLIIAMALFRDCAIRTIAMQLGLVLPSGRKATDGKAESIAPSSVSEARGRLGEAPMKHIFLQSARRWVEPAVDEDRWRGLSLWGLDGSTLNIPDTADNDEAFGRPATGRQQSGYPQVRLVALMAVRARLLRSAAFGPCRGKKTGEQSLARQLWDDIPEDALVLFDRNFIDYASFYRFTHDADGAPCNRHWLTRAKANLRWETIETLGPGDELVEFRISSAARKRDPGLPKTVRARAIHYQMKGFRPQILLTSLTDADAYPARELVELYHERWETELGYDELKTNLLEREEALRSRTASGVRQELWGILLAYNLIRRKMLDVAHRVDLPPRRISFKNCAHVIRAFCHAHALATAPAKLPEAIEQLDQMLSVYVLPERRPDRRYDRQVKIKMSNYKRKPGRSSSSNPPKSRS